MDRTGRPGAGLFYLITNRRLSNVSTTFKRLRNRLQAVFERIMMVNPEESFVLSKIKRTPVERELSAETNPLLFLFQSYVRLRRLELANDEVSSQTCLWFSCDSFIYSRLVLFSCEVS